MSFLAAWNQTGAEIFYKTGRFENWKLCPCKKGWSLQNDRNKIELQPGQKILCSKAAFACISDQTSFIPLKKEFCFMRDQVHDPGVSLRHFVLEDSDGKGGWILSDCSSTNGTYLNGVRIRKSPIHTGDWIFAAGYCFLFVNEGLIVSAKIGKPVEQSPLWTFNPAVPVEWNPIVVQTIEVEAPASISAPAKPHWFTSIGPAGLILVSSVASASITYLQNPDNLQAVMTSSATSLSMAGAFLVFGLINRKISIKSQRQPSLRQAELYQSYLETLENSISIHVKSVQNRFLLEQKKLNALEESLHRYDSEWILPGFCSIQPAIHLSFPKIRYDQKKDALFLKMMELNKIPQTVSGWDFLRAGEAVQICCSDKEVVRFFKLWCWCIGSECKKWVWITRKRPQISNHPACMLNGQFLWFEQAAEFEQFARNLDQDWIVYLEEYRKISPLKNRVTLIYGPQAFKDRPDEEGVVRRLESFCFEGSFPESKFRLSARYWQSEKAKTGFDWAGMIEKAWEKRKTREHPFRICLGDELFWDLEEDGPHVLIAGTTGSGKSEGLLYLLAMLALQNAPEYLKMILVDFKGGSFKNVFSRYAHLSGSLSNLDESSFERLEKAVNKELRKRQLLIARFLEEYPYETGDLVSYNKKSAVPISHLVIVVDEFAELKSKYPAAMHYLQETARIGRSLGIHLILSTQSPGGVVDDQIWKNSKTKICFRVNTASDSREVLQCADAAELSNPGEMIVLVSGKQPLKAKMPYIREPWKKQPSFCLSDAQGSCIYEQKQAQSALEKITEQVLEAGDKRCWILHPDLCESMSLYKENGEDLSLGIPLRPEDLSFDQKSVRISRYPDFDQLKSVFSGLSDQIDSMQLWSLPFRLWIQTPASRISSALNLAAGNMREPVYGCGKLVCNVTQMIPAGNLWQLETIRNGSLLIQGDDLDDDFAAELCQLKIQAVIVSSRSLQRRTRLLNVFDYRMAVNGIAKEDEYLLFSKNGKLPEFPLFKLKTPSRCVLTALFESEKQRMEHRMIHLLKNPMKEKEFLSQSGLLLGFESQRKRAVYAPESKPLLIACAQQSALELIGPVLELWKIKKPDLIIERCSNSAGVCLIKLPEDQSWLQSKDGMHMLYDSSVCFIGKGYKDFQYLLKTPPAMQANFEACLFDEKTTELEICRISSKSADAA